MNYGLFGPREGEEVLSCNQTIVMVLFACLIVVVDLSIFLLILQYYLYISMYLVLN